MFLGVDIGTSKVAAVLIDRLGRVAATASANHNAGVAGLRHGRAEQDPVRLLGCLRQVVEELPAELRQRIAGIGVTGQMHGVMVLDADAKPLSNLIAWQDQRCLTPPEFLSDLQQQTGCELRTGYGCATLAWLQKHGQIPEQAACASTVHDWIVAELCGLSRPFTDPTDAASFGLFDLDANTWNPTAVAAAKIPGSLLPEIVECGTRAGSLTVAQAECLGLPAGVPVAVAIGDNQASLLATLDDPEHELALTLGTGGQLSAVLPGLPENLVPRGGFEYRPYPGGRVAAVAATLNGGAAWSWLAHTAVAWCRDLGMEPPPVGILLDRLDALGLDATDEIDINPRFAGERAAPDGRGQITGIGADSMPLGPLARGLARGIMTNLRHMLPDAMLRGRTRIVASGNALRRNQLLQTMACKVFEMPLHVSDSREEAATGAAKIAIG